MAMRIKRFVWSAAPLCLALWCLACGSAKKPVAPVLPPPPAGRPAVQSAAPAKAPSVTPARPKAAAAPVATSAQAERKTELPKVDPKDGPKVDPVAELVATAEKEYLAGQADYEAGNPDRAKERFDRAFSVMMGKSAEYRNDPRFKREFDRITDGIGKLEFAALQQSDSTAEQQKSEPAPIDEANEVTNYPVDQNIKAKATAELKATHSDLPLMMTDQVAGYINYFSTRGRETLERALTRSGRYREMIQRVLREEGVPQDLIYLAQAESGFHPYAVSRVGARGIWQFMGSRAKGYGLHRDFFVDERQDPEKSTRAAARHLKDLYNQFGDWYLAMAAYNSGPGTVQSAVKRTGYADFWELYRRNVLPRETRNYVPIIVAVTIMAKNPGQYGLDSIVPDPAMQFDTVKLDYPVDLRLVADCVDVSPVELQELNPALLRMTTPKGHFELRLPPGSADRFTSAIASVPPEMRVWWRYHKVTPGETLMSVARAYHTTAKSIAGANQIEPTDQIEAGAKLVIPIAPGKHPAGDVQTYARRLTVYHIRKGDTLQSVSENLGVQPNVIRRWNRIKDNSLTGRRVLYVHLPVSPTEAAAESKPSKWKQKSHLASPKPGQQLHHTVKPGETLYSIANNYKTSVAALKQTNAHLATLRPGMVLLIPAE
jgi:membrane-bound lytic murein transglycosylase D